jgi:D-alanyl-D-alanine endopeptidase (penicillin-binding protein 7)
MKFVAIAVMFLLQIGIANANPSGPLKVKSQSVLVVDLDSNEILYQKNSDTVKPIASITKLMTALVTVDAGLDLAETVTIEKEDVLWSRSSSGNTGTSLPVGAVISRDDLLRLTLMNSHNRAAAALARTYPGGREAFINAMNEKAAELGMHHTKYADPTGLMNSNVSTAEDLAKLALVVEGYPTISEYSTTARYKIPDYKRVYGTTNRLVTLDSWKISLQKTGYIKDAGRCVVMITEVAYRRVAIVLLHAVSNQQRALDAVAIKYWLENDAVPTQAVLKTLNPYKKKKVRRS